MSKSLPYSSMDSQYDNAKFRSRSFLQAVNQFFLISKMKQDLVTCSTVKFLVLVMICGLTYLTLTHILRAPSISNVDENSGGIKFHRIWSERLGFHSKSLKNDSVSTNDIEESKWVARQQNVKEALIHAWSGYRNYAMGYDELNPLTHGGTDGLGGLGATIVDALDTAIIMEADEIIDEAGKWIEAHLSDRVSLKGQVNLFETTIRVLGGLLSAYHLSGGGREVPVRKGPKPMVYLEIAKKLADSLLSAFTSSPSSIPFSDVVLRDQSAHAAPDGLSSTSEVSTVQLEFNYLTALSGDSRYRNAGMKVFEHIRNLSKFEGLVPIYISPHSGEFVGENIRLGSRGDSYYEYLIKVWIQQRARRDSNVAYLYDMYKEAINGVKHLLVQKSIPNGLVFIGELPSGITGALHPKMDHLACFFPATLALGATKGMTKSDAMRKNLLTFDDLDDLKLAEGIAKTCFEMYSVTATGLAPEIVYFHTEEFFEQDLDGGNKSSEYINDIIIKRHDRHNLLRPETLESLFVLYRITEDAKYREWGWQIFEAFERYTKVKSGGYSSLDDVTTLPPRRRDKMETFFLGETLKYLYLLFGDKNVIPLDRFVFNSEAHPIPIDGIGIQPWKK